MYKGELISLLVTLLWTVTAMAAEVASKRLSPLGLNVVRMLMSLAFLAILMWVVCGQPWPQDADGETWLWLSLSGFVGYVLGDYCLFNSYLLMGSRFGQLFMTLAPAVAALFGFILLGETMSPLAIVGMLITMFGIGLSVLSRGGEHHTLSLKLPLKGILFGIGAGMGQGIGLVLSFSYILFTTVTASFAVSGVTSPMVAEWIPNIVFSIIAIVLYRRAAV